MPNVKPSTSARAIDIRVAVSGQIIVGNRRDVQRRLRDSAKHAWLVVLDIREIGYIDSSGIGMLLNVASEIAESGARLVVANPNDDLRTLFELTKFDRAVEIIYTDVPTCDPATGLPSPTSNDPLNVALDEIQRLTAIIATLREERDLARAAISDSFARAYDLVLQIERPSLASPHRFNDTEKL